MTLMRAAVSTEHGVQLRELERPRPRAHEVLVQVHASALNRLDLAAATGHSHGPASGPGTALGIEFAGVVVEAGSEVEGLAVGDRVACSGRGGHADYAVADWGRSYKLSPDFPFERAVLFPVAVQTMHDALATQARLAKGETVLIQGASSGVGLMGLQIARLLGASTVLGTSTDAGRLARLKEWGADHAIDARDPAWPEEVVRLTGGQGAHVVIDQVSGRAANGNLQATRIAGRIVNVGRLGGDHGDFDFELHALKRIQYIGVSFRTRSIDEVRQITQRVRDALWPAVESGALRLPLDRSFAFDDVEAALAHMASNTHFGKIVLKRKSPLPT